MSPPAPKRNRHLLRSIRNADLRDASQAAVDAGWAIRLSGSGHIVLTRPDGAARVVLSASASDDGRTVKNVIAYLRRAGAPLPPRKTGPQHA